MACHGRDTESWPQVIYRLWRVAQAERKRLVIDRCDGDRFVISAGPVATRAEAVEFVDDDGSRRILEFVEIVRILLIAGQRRPREIPSAAVGSHHRRDEHGGTR